MGISRTEVSVQGQSKRFARRLESGGIRHPWLQERPDRERNSQQGGAGCLCPTSHDPGYS